MKRAVLLAVAVALVPFTLSAQIHPTLVLTNGKVFTADPARPWAEAVAIQDSKIVAVGTVAEIRRLLPAEPKFPVINLRGRVVIPGINDAHVHAGNAISAFGAPVEMDTPWSGVKLAIEGAAAETHADTWIIVTLGPRLINDTSITRTALDQIAPGRKVMLRAFTGHGLVLSSAAMTALGVAENATDPVGGWIGRDSNNRLNGRFVEYAQYAIDRRYYDQASDADLVDAIRTFSDELLQYGITSVQVMSLPSEKRLLSAWRAAGVPVRLRLINFPLTLESPLAEGARGVKWIFDGTPIEQGAAVRSAYRDGGQGKGRINFEDMSGPIKVARVANQQLLVHAVGDATIAKLLAEMHRISQTEWPSKRPRIEHADGLQRDQFDMAKRLGVIVVQNPAHFAFRKAFPEGDYDLAKSIVNAGIPFALGSDGPLNPFLNIMFATDRPDLPAEALTREQALTAYTATSAYAEFAEGQKGKIAPGMLADLAVLSEDMFTWPTARLPEIRSVLTIIDGKIVHRTLP